MKLLISTASVIVMLCALPALAGFDIEQATTRPADCNAPAVASSDAGLTMLAYGARGEIILVDFVMTQLVPTHPTPGEVWPEPVTLNAGYSPVICWTRQGFVAAFSSGGMILIYESDLEGNWDKENFTMLDPGGAVMGLDLWGVPTDAAGPYAFLTTQVSTNPPYEDFKVAYTAGNASTGWADFEVVAEEAIQMPRPQMTWATGPAGPWPRIYFLTDAFGGVDLVHTTKDPAVGWSVPTVVPGDGATGPSPIHGSFDVVTSWALSVNVLGLGPQPTCPCGTIHFLGNEYGNGWDPQVPLTVNHSYYDSPGSPRLSANLADPAGQVHAFWMQVGSGTDLEAKTTNLEYWVKTEGGWVDAGGFLDGQDDGPLGLSVALDVSPDNNVVMAWTRRDTLGGVPQPQQIWMARPHEAADVPGSRGPGATAAVTAWPNPFNPRVRMALSAEIPGPATLDVYDLRGRHVIRLFEGELSAAGCEVDWDGRDLAGRPAPSGVYFARLKSVTGSAVTKLVLAE